MKIWICKRLQTVPGPNVACTTALFNLQRTSNSHFECLQIVHGPPKLFPVPATLHFPIPALYLFIPPAWACRQLLSISNTNIMDCMFPRQTRHRLHYKTVSWYLQRFFKKSQWYCNPIKTKKGDAVNLITKESIAQYHLVDYGQHY